MPNGPSCSDFVQGFRAYDNIDLVPNGYIDQYGTDKKGKRVKLLPSSRIGIEFQYSVRSDATGTSLNNLSPGGNAGFISGTLGGGAGFAIGAAIGTELLGDLEPTKSRFIFHICDAESFLNREIILTQKMIDSGQVELPYYVVAVLGVTKSIISFTADELANLGASGGITRGARVAQNGQIQKDFSGFTYTDTDINFFRGIAYDDRRITFRADNQDAKTNCFISSNEDDLVTKKINIQTVFSPKEGQTESPLVLKPGDKLYISYLAVTKRLARQAMYISSTFFLFPDFSVERLSDRVLAWNFRPYEFHVHKNQLNSDVSLRKRGTLSDLKKDREIDKQISAVQNNDTLSDAEKTTSIANLENQKSLDKIEGQRIVEVLNDTKNQTPYIRGFYFADSRGILKYNMETQDPPEVLLARADITDQSWFNEFLSKFNDGGTEFDSNGVLDPSTSSAQARLFKGFYFDVSQHVNTACTDNEKFGYQKDFALALKQVKTSIGIPNLDLVKKASDDNFYDLANEDYDLSSAVFAPYKMSSIEGGSYFVRDCNKMFTYDLQFGSSGTLQADMFVRTPFFFDRFSLKSRIYVERFSPQLGLDPDGGIWVFTQAVGIADNMSCHTHPGDHFGGLVFADSKSSTLNYNLFVSSKITASSEILRRRFDSSHNHDNYDINNLQEQNIRVIGYDKIIGNIPSYSRGREILTDGGKIRKGILNPKDAYIAQEVSYSFDQTNGSIFINGLDNKKIKRITIQYNSISGSSSDATLAVIFPSNQWVIDNIAFSPSSLDAFIDIDCACYYDDNVKIIGEGLKYIDIISITAVFIKDDIYNECKIETNKATTFFDKSGNWYVIYEDSKAENGAKASISSDVDGSVLQSLETTEISCLVSYDMGLTWFDHKGIIRTVGNDSTSLPYAVIDPSTDIVNLFYVLNNCLLNKRFSISKISISDSFKAYQRPSQFTEKTSDNFGLDHFSEEGQYVRKVESQVVAGLLDKTNKDNYLATQIRLSEDRKKSGKSFRIFVSGDSSYLKSEFTESDFVPIINQKGSLQLFFIRDGKLYCLNSSDSLSWISLYTEGLLIHRHTDKQEPRYASNIGIIYNKDIDQLTLTYISDQMMFMRRFKSSIFDKSEKIDHSTYVNASSSFFSAVFLVGQMTDELRKAILDCSTGVKYLYGKETLDQFNEKMSISNVGSAGFICSNGLSRIFYRDGLNYIRGMSIGADDPILDVKMDI